MEMGSVRCCLVKLLPCFSWNTRTFGWESYHQSPHNMTLRNSKTGCHRLMQLQASIGKHPVSFSSWRAHCTSINLEESSSIGSEDNPNAEESSQESPEELLSKPLSSDELKALLADSERANLLRKLSEANQQNRFLKRQLHMKEEALVDFKSELAVTELEIQALVKLAKEIAKSAIPEGSRKINGKYIQSHLLSRLEGALSVANRSTFLKKNFEAVLEKLKEQIKDVEVAQSKEVPLFWYGVAESVQVMGTFDGWSQGESLSPEYTGSYTMFSTILPLRPGRYEIKFLVDGEWQLSPEFPTVGEGLMQNNLLIVE